MRYAKLAVLNHKNNSDQPMLPDMKQTQDKFWDNAALNKEFKDPLYLDHLQKLTRSNDFIIEYGCGYGRILDLLYQNNYRNISGFDFSKGMIERGTKKFPQLNLKQISHASIPLNNACTDVAILSTVLCCVPDSQSQTEIINEIERVLKPNGILYLSDFLITETDDMLRKYQHGFEKYNLWGIYSTSEGAIVRHHEASYIKKLLNNFTMLWYREENFVTMNNNTVKTFHGIYRKTHL